MVKTDKIDLKLDKTKDYSADIPLCPYCQIATEREQGETEIIKDPIPVHYDKNGAITHPVDTTKTIWHCLNCGNFYAIIGNITDGFRYGKQ